MCRTVRRMKVDWTDELVGQLSFHWDNVLRPRLDTLTDEQYLWEPVDGMWSIRPRSDATTPMAAVAADVVIDDAVPEPTPPPLTTIPWRLGHLVSVFGQRASNHFGNGSFSDDTVDWPLTAAGMLELLDHHHDAWMTGIKGLDVAGLTRPCGPAEGPFADYPFAGLVLHINREVLHHGAEITLLLDLHTHHFGGSR